MFVLSGLGPNWKWGNQDGGAGNIGRVYAVNGGVVEVLFFYYPHSLQSGQLLKGEGESGGGGGCREQPC